ncbi:hypothetical protein BS50DRAFT_651056 [Corynespora cassiicola Philippines]|uniref:Uncharacterized protein n=1 Tax=Corynespora cassiicola Philippines TaxID=1448308 RepID=A0A2T2N8E3_CORCC|nr:hypothetical protein BS50DRAFT_651056 [Corynespora cassiicola Philippines]
MLIHTINYLTKLEMDPLSIAFTVGSAIGLVNSLFSIYRNVRRWLKSRDPLWKENTRMMKILKSYFKRNSDPNERVPEHLRAMIEILNERKANWKDVPGAQKAEREARMQQRYKEVGYTTDYDSSDDESDGFPEGYDNYDGESPEDDEESLEDEDPLYDEESSSSYASSDEDDEYGYDYD